MSVAVAQHPAAMLDELRLVELPDGAFTMGTDGPARWMRDGEGPARQVHVPRFAIASTPVTTSTFAAFVEATSHVTDAERYGWSFVFAHQLSPSDRAESQAMPRTPWWRAVAGADWRHPSGPSSTLEGLEAHPVTHVSHDDAVAFCAWLGARLPTEAEWERAARGGIEGARYSWGDDGIEPPSRMCNIFAGSFPNRPTSPHARTGTSPVGAYPANELGLYDTAGNVWEWCSDWYGRRPSSCCVAHDPTGPVRGTMRVLRGGSFLCHDSYCDRYRVTGRTGNEPDTSAANIGFRIALDAPPKE